jgi:hypothetical protein
LLYLEEIPNSRPALGGLDIVGAKKACARSGADLFLLGHSGRGRVPLFQSGRDWFARVRLSEDYPPELNVNLTLPRSAPVVKESGKAGVISLDYLRTVPSRALRGRIAQGAHGAVQKLGSPHAVSHLQA